MCAWNSLDAVFFEHAVQPPTRAAVSISNEHVAIVLPIPIECLCDCCRNLVRRIVQLGRQALDAQVLPLVEALQIDAR